MINEGVIGLHFIDYDIHWSDAIIPLHSTFFYCNLAAAKFVNFQISIKKKNPT